MNDVVHPCRVLGFCPYGSLVEQFPLPDEGKEDESNVCSVFGHICPVHRVAEPLGEALIEDFDELCMAVQDAIDVIHLNFYGDNEDG